MYAICSQDIVKSRIKVGYCQVKNIQMKDWGKEGTAIEAVEGKRRKALLCVVNKFTTTQDILRSMHRQEEEFSILWGGWLGHSRAYKTP